MLQTIITEIKKALLPSLAADALLVNGQQRRIQPEQFSPLSAPESLQKTLAFVDGGQAEILNAGNVSLSFIRVAAVVFSGTKKERAVLRESYVFTKGVFHGDEIAYESAIFPLGEPLLDEKQLQVSSRDPLLATGHERAAISSVANMARRFSELALARELAADSVLLDGTLDATYPGEAALLQQLGTSVCALAKTSMLWTKNGQNPVVLLSRMGPPGCWQYAVDERRFFVKLHEKAKHVFSFQGAPEHLPSLLQQARDAVFLGYPYGLILADKFARVSNQERQMLRTQILLRKENKAFVEALQATNAHEILDSLG